MTEASPPVDAALRGALVATVLLPGAALARPARPHAARRFWPRRWRAAAYFTPHVFRTSEPAQRGGGRLR